LNAAAGSRSKQSMATLHDMVRAIRSAVWPLQLELLTRRSLLMAAVWLIIVNAFALIAFNRLNLAPDTAFEWMSAGTVRPVQPSWDIIELHNRWDAYWYLDIAQNGYYLRGDKDIANVVFFRSTRFWCACWGLLPAATWCWPAGY